MDRLPLMPITMQLAADLIKVKYRDYSTNFRLLAEGQVMVAEMFEFDYVNTMSDPGREAADCGAVIEAFENSPAAMVEEQALLADKADLLKLKVPNPLGGGRMNNGIKAVAHLKELIGKEKIVEGWIEGPCAEAADLRGINTLMLDFYDDPKFVRDLFDFVIEMETAFAREQVRAGADVIGIGDAAASLVGPQIYEEFVWPYEKKLVQAVQELGAAVRLHICGNTRFALPLMGQLGCEIVDLDSAVSLQDARAKMGGEQVLLGNINPVTVLRNGTPDQVFDALAGCHAASGDRYIIGAGCEVPRDTPHENVRALLEYARSYSSCVMP